MPVSISRRILRSFGSLGVGRCSSPCLTYQLFLTSLDVCGRVSGDCLFFAESSSFIKGGAASLTYRRFSTSILTPGSSDGAFPSDLFSTKTVLTPEGNIGLGDSGDKFHNEDKGFMVLVGDVFDVPIKKHIIHCDGNLQNNNREHIQQKQSVKLVGLVENHINKRALVEQGMENCVDHSLGLVLQCMALSHRVDATRRFGG